MYSLLIVDDEEMIRKLIRKYAEFEGYSVAEAADGMEAVMLCREKSFDLIIMDIMMPELDGFSACREIRKNSQIPIIMLSARGEEYDKINGFGLGIDDYVVKPFSPKELMMRVNAVLRRISRTEEQKQAENSNEIFIFEDLTVDFTARTVHIDKSRIDMSPKEYDLLFYMIRNKNIALTREKLITNVWGYDFYGDDRTHFLQLIQMFEPIFINRLRNCASALRNAHHGRKGLLQIRRKTRINCRFYAGRLRPSLASDQYIVVSIFYSGAHLLKLCTKSFHMLWNHIFDSDASSC